MAACGAAVPAVAADNDAIVPDASRQATLDIHKLSGTESTTRADGTALAPEEVAKYGKPMGGVVFDVYKVSGIDVSTNEGLKVDEKIHERKVTAADMAAGNISVDGQSGLCSGQGGSVRNDWRRWLGSGNLWAGCLCRG